jgi:hypothetical protein
MSEGNWIQQKREGCYTRRPRNDSETFRKTREDRGKDFSSYGKERMTDNYGYNRRREVRERKPDKFVYSQEMFPQMSQDQQISGSEKNKNISTQSTWCGNLKNLIDEENESEEHSEKKNWGVVDKRFLGKKPLTKYQKDQIMNCCVNPYPPRETYIQKIMKEIWYDRFEKHYDSKSSDSSNDDLNGYSFPIDEWSEVSEITSEFLEEYDNKYLNDNSDDDTSDK